MVAAMQGTENYQIWQRRSDTCKGSILFPFLWYTYKLNTTKSWKRKL